MFLVRDTAFQTAYVAWCQFYKEQIAKDTHTHTHTHTPRAAIYSCPGCALDKSSHSERNMNGAQWNWTAPHPCI